MRSLISMIAAVVMLFLLTTSVSADAPERDLIEDDRFRRCAESALSWAADGGDSLAEKFISDGSAATSAADWFIISAAAMGFEDDYTAYSQAAAKILAEVSENPGNHRATEPARIAAAIKICGGEAAELPEYDMDDIGVNELIWLAAAKKMNGGDNSAELTALRDRQHSDGGFGLDASDADITAMALCVLPQDSTESASAVKYLSEYYIENGAEISSETAAWVIIGLCAQGKSPSSDSGFTLEDGVRPIDILLSLQNPDGGFAHISGGESNAISTGQAVMALAALAVFSGGGELFSADLSPADIYSLENLSCESFDEYDIKRLNSFEDPLASDRDELAELYARALRFGADDDIIFLAENRLTKSENALAEIEDLNARIKAGFYPADKISVLKLGELKEINKKISGYAEKDRGLILFADKLYERERILERYIFIIALAGTVFIGVSAFIVIRKVVKRRE